MEHIKITCSNTLHSVYSIENTHGSSVKLLSVFSYSQKNQCEVILMQYYALTWCMTSNHITWCITYMFKTLHGFETQCI